MLKTDFVTEIKVLLIREHTSATQATKGICSRQTWHRALENKTIIPKCVEEVLDKLGYDIEINFIKRD